MGTWLIILFGRFLLRGNPGASSLMHWGKIVTDSCHFMKFMPLDKVLLYGRIVSVAWILIRTIMLINVSCLHFVGYFTWLEYLSGNERGALARGPGTAGIIVQLQLTYIYIFAVIYRLLHGSEDMCTEAVIIVSVCLNWGWMIVRTDSMARDLTFSPGGQGQGRGWWGGVGLKTLKQAKHCCVLNQNSN